MLKLTCLLFCTTSLASLALAATNSDHDLGSRTNGGVTFTLTKDYLEYHQAFAHKLIIKEAAEIKLRDVRVSQKTDLGRLTSVMSNVHISEMNFELANISYDFINTSPVNAEVDCHSDFEVMFKMTGVSMKFDFDQWLETESTFVTEEWATGSFFTPNITFTMVAEPYVLNEKMRMRIKDLDLKIGAYDYELRTQENSQFQLTLENYSALFADYMLNTVQVELSDGLGLATQKAVYGLFKRVQHHNKLDGRDIFMNKHLINLCYVQGEATTDAKGKVIKRGPGAVSLEIDGTFHRSQDLLKNKISSDVAVADKSLADGFMQVQIKKTVLDSLLESVFKEKGTIQVNEKPFVMKVEDLEDMIEGFITAFDEDSEVKINAHLDKVLATQLDSDFGNIPFRAELTISFSNPIDERFLAATAKIAFKGTAEVTFNHDYTFNLNLIQEKVKVQSFQPYFLSETTLAEFEEEFVNSLQKQVLDAFINLAKQGSSVPLACDIKINNNLAVSSSIQNDYILIQAERRPGSEPDQRYSLSQFSTHDPVKQAKKLRDFPIRWLVDQDHKVVQLGSNDEIYRSSNTGKTCSGPSCDTRAVNKQQDEL